MSYLEFTNQGPTPSTPPRVVQQRPVTLASEPQVRSYPTYPRHVSSPAVPINASRVISSTTHTVELPVTTITRELPVGSYQPDAVQAAAPRIPSYTRSGVTPAAVTTHSTRGVPVATGGGYSAYPNTTSTITYPTATSAAYPATASVTRAVESPQLSASFSGAYPSSATRTVMVNQGSVNQAVLNHAISQQGVEYIHDYPVLQYDPQARMNRSTNLPNASIYHPETTFMVHPLSAQKGGMQPMYDSGSVPTFEAPLCFLKEGDLTILEQKRISSPVLTASGRRLMSNEMPQQRMLSPEMTAQPIYTPEITPFSSNSKFMGDRAVSSYADFASHGAHGYKRHGSADQGWCC